MVLLSESARLSRPRTGACVDHGAWVENARPEVDTPSGTSRRDWAGVRGVPGSTDREFGGRQRQPLSLHVGGWRSSIKVMAHVK